MYTATKDLTLPTTVTGSWPRPSWYTTGLWGKSFSNGMNDIEFREQFSDAISALISDQERAGLDILTNGDFHHDPDFGGRSWVQFGLERLGGTSDGSAGRGITLDEFPYPPGSLLNEVFAGWQIPAVEGELGGDVPLEYGKIWRVAQQRAQKPVKFGIASAQIAGSMLQIDGDYYDGDTQKLMWELAGLYNRELRALADAGCKVIQVEEPMIHPSAFFGSDEGLMDFLVECINREIEGLDDVEVWIHTCWGNPNMQKTMEGSYEKSLEIYMERVNADVWTLEHKDNPQAVLAMFDKYRGDMPKKVALGVVSHRDLQADTPEQVATLVREALDHIDPEHLVLSTNCGFGRQGFNRLVAFYKSVAIAGGANIVRQELGLPQTPIPAMDPDLQADVRTATQS